eukprot:scaffold269_cov404-Prasinococcus_capsulatus_cf.AAC.6
MSVMSCHLCVPARVDSATLTCVRSAQTLFKNTSLSTARIIVEYWCVTTMYADRPPLRLSGSCSFRIRSSTNCFARQHMGSESDKRLAPGEE